MICSPPPHRAVFAMVCLAIFGLINLANGQSWTNVAQGQSVGSFFGIASSGTKMVAVGIDGRIATRDIQSGNWTIQIFPGDPDFRAVVYAGGQFVAVREKGEIRTSPDGINWTLRSSGSTSDLRAIIHDGSKYIVAGQSGTILTSSNAVSWTSRNSGSSIFFNSLSYSGSRYIAVGGFGIRWSSDTINWFAPSAAPPSISFEASTWTGSRFIAGGLGSGSTATLYWSSDGSSWSLLNSQVKGNIEAAITVGTDIYITGDNAFVMRSQDNGQSWSNIYPNPSGSEYFMSLAADAQNLIVAGFNHNVFVKSHSGATNPTPTPTPTPSPTPPTSVSSDLTILVAKYGAEGVFSDVRELLQQQVSENSLQIHVRNDTMGGDPIFGVSKNLLVQYATSAGSFEVTVPEWETLRIPDSGHNPINGGGQNPIDQIGANVSKQKIVEFGDFQPTITTDSVSTRVQINWFAEDKLKFQVLRSTDLISWNNFGGEITGGGFDTAISFIPTDSQGFFKIVRSGDNVINARYGADTTFVDVTGYVSNLQKTSPAGFVVSNGSLGGDPLFGKVKNLEVTIAKADGIYLYIAREGSLLDLRQ
jgi:photosystem II stability/assembly factor-like uncharacterized protein